MIVAAFPWLIVGVIFALIYIPQERRKRRDRRRIMADGLTAQGAVRRIGTPTKTGRSVVYFQFQPQGAGSPIETAQSTTQAAVDQLRLSVGAPVTVNYLPKWPKWGFIDAIVRVERQTFANSKVPVDSPAGVNPPDLFYVNVVGKNRFRWMGNGDLWVRESQILITVEKQRSFWFAGRAQVSLLPNHIADVEQHDATMRFTVNREADKAYPVQLKAANAEQAAALVKRLPATKSAKFVPLLAEAAQFQATLRAVTPHAFVTPTLIALNFIMLAIATTMGAGLIKINPDVMIRLGTDYTPLTLGGQWWRLLTSTFLHFGLLHFTFNMWALYLNGVVAERIYGSLRFLVIYLVAGLSGSVVSLLWHPIVNGAGASGAIFGVLGSLIAFFLRRDHGVPASATKAQLQATSIFVIYSLIGGLRVSAIDNAAHVGGLIGGFGAGLLLCRPLNIERNDKTWTLHWVTSLAVIVGTAILIAHSLAIGTLKPRLANNNAYPAALPIQHTLGGMRIGMTTKELIAQKGPPINLDGYMWVYNSVDARHNGALTAVFDGLPMNDNKTIRAIEYTGDKESAPTDLPFLNGSSFAEARRRYGEPKNSSADKRVTWYQFNNGVFVAVANNKIINYGVYRIATDNASQ